MRARVGAMPQPKGIHHDQPSSRGGNRARVHSGMSLEDLKRETAYRLAQEGGPDGADESPEHHAASIGSQDQANTAMHYQYHPNRPQGHQYPREPPNMSSHYAHMSPQHVQYQQRGRDYPSYGYDVSNSYSSDSTGTRNYTDSQLGIGGASMNQFASPPHGYRPGPQPVQQQQQYATPRMPRHAAVLKDRGSTENSVGSDPSGGSESAAYGYSSRGNAKRASSPAVKGNRVGSYGKNLNKAGRASGAKAQPSEARSPDGRHTPVRECNNMEGQVLFATPNHRPAPTTPYTEPARNKAGSRPHPAMSPNYNRMRSPDHHPGGYVKGGGRAYYDKNQQNKNQSKLPHGLTVQELKEMTRARLAAEAETGGQEGASDQSVHSSGTHNSSKGSDQLQSGWGSNPAQSTESVTRNLVQSNEAIRQEYSNQGPAPQPFQGQQQMQQMHPQPGYRYPRHPSPIFGAPANSNHFNGNQPPQGGPRLTTPPFGLSSSQTRPQGETWESASVNSGTPAPEYQEHAFHNANMNMAFTSPVSDSNAMAFNRARCLSAGATTGAASSYERHQAAYYENVPLTGPGNRQRCATVSPPGMSRLHEDRPYLFSSDDKERLALPSLSAPRQRLHTTGGLSTHSTAMRAFESSVSPPPTNFGSGSAFVPITKTNDQFLPHSPPPLSIERTKFGVGDRTLSTESAASLHGDLPSSMAEAVLESITSNLGAPIGGQIIGASPFRPVERDVVGESPFRVSDSSDNTSSAFRLDNILAESTGSMSLFSSGDSRNLFTTEKDSGERVLLGTQSWGGADDDVSNAHLGLSHDFSSLLNLSGGNQGTPLRGRAATEPAWLFGGHDPHLVSRIDPEHNGERKAPPRVSSLVDTNNAPIDLQLYAQQNMNQNMNSGGI